MAASSPVASETGTVGSFSLIGTDTDTGNDYMLLSTIETEAAPAEVEANFECDPLLTKETLAAQLQEMEKVMEHLGLEPKPEAGVAASGAKPLSGFVQADTPAETPTLQTLERETLTLQMDQATETFTIEGWESLVPALPGAAKYLRDLTHGELRSLLEAFRSSPWTAPLVIKIAEVYHISKREAAHTQMLKRRHTTQRGGSMTNLKDEDPGTSPQLVCADCNAPWGQFSKCLLCQGSQSVDLSVTPLSVIEVAGQSWQLRLTEAGPTWVPTDTKVAKASGFVEVGDLGRPPPAAASSAGMGLVSFSEQVPTSQRVTLQQHVATFGADEIFHPDGARPPTMADRDSTQTAVIFHPKTIELMRFKADLLATPEEELTEAAQEAKKRKKDLLHQQESVAMEEEIHTLTAIQQGALETPHPVGAKMLRHADLQQFRSYLKRKHKESGVTSSYEALLAAQTTQEKAAAANKALDTEFRGRRMALKPIEVAPFSLWTPELQEAWQNNILAPATGPQGPEQFDIEALKQPYLRMKELIKDNKPPLSQDRLMTEFPKTQLDMYTMGEAMASSQEAQLARLLPPDSLERKYAILDSILQYHKGEVRAWGGEWELREGPLTAPAWAKPAPTSEVLALELRTNPLGISSYMPRVYTEQVVLQQISDGKRPALDKIIGFFWAPGTAVASGTDESHLV